MLYAIAMGQVINKALWLNLSKAFDRSIAHKFTVQPAEYMAINKFSNNVNGVAAANAFLVEAKLVFLSNK